MLGIDNLHATVDGKPILKGISLTLNPGEIHAIMGPYGSGKSSLSCALAGLPLALAFCASAAAAQERCVAAEYRLPPSIADEMRPYLVCGMIRADGHIGGARLNGQWVSMQGGGVENCGRVRSLALEASDRRLATIMPDAAERRRFLEAEFEKADRFLAAAARSDDLSVGESPSAPKCRRSPEEETPPGARAEEIPGISLEGSGG